MTCIVEHINRARYLLRSEGTLSFFRRLFIYLSSYIFSCKQYYVRQHFVGELNEADFLPKVKDFTFKLVTSNEIADDWVKQTGLDFRDQILHARRRLDAGAIAFCIFIQNELACILWLGLNQKAKNWINPQPYKVNFLKHQQCTGGGETVPKYRGYGLMKYAAFQRNNYMIQHSISMLIDIVEINNVAIYKIQHRFPTKIVARARYIKLLWWQYWKETPLPEAFTPLFE